MQYINPDDAGWHLRAVWHGNNIHQYCPCMYVDLVHKRENVPHSTDWCTTGVPVSFTDYDSHLPTLHLNPWTVTRWNYITELLCLAMHYVNAAGDGWCSEVHPTRKQYSPILYMHVCGPSAQKGQCTSLSWLRHYRSASLIHRLWPPTHPLPLSPTLPTHPSTSTPA